MKNLFAILIPLFIGIVFSTNVLAQSPEKMSFQAVIRNASDALIANQTVGMQISILQGSTNGTAVYVETQTPTTNINGLVSIEIGSGTIVSGTFSSIDWANGLYFIKTETDPTGGTNYTVSGTSQLLSVPFALHAKTAESITGGITESDPVFGSSIANGITAGDTSNWNNHFSGDYNDLNNAPTNVSTFTNDVGYLTGFTETDPNFNASVAAGITALDTTNWNNHFSGDYDDLNNAPSNVSAFNNDAGYITTFTEIDPKIGSNTLGFSPKWDGSTLVTGAIYQDPTNKIGIGTTTPTNALSVIGSGDFSTSVKSPLYTPLAGDGNSLTIQANNSSSGAGGNVNIYSGIGNPGNLGGQINIVAAPINAGVGQAVSIIGSDNSGGGGNNAGPVVIRGGNATVANGGIVSITGGSSGGGNSAAAGVVNITGGAHVGSSPQLCGGADVNISGGPQTVASGAGVGGSVILKGGVSSGSGAHGSILMQTGATSSTRLVIDPNGNVGIGNNNPSARLHIGNGTLSAASSDASIFLQSGNGAGSARDWKIYVPMSNGYLGFRDMGFDNSNNGMSADAMAIQYGTGNVGIGTTNPTSKLEVDGQIKVTGGTASQFLKADGSLDNTNYVTQVELDAALASIIVEVADEFTSTASQTEFTLTQTPSGNSKVKMYINGIRISNTAYSVSGTTLTYISANNGSYVLTASDRIQFDYYY